MESFYDNVSKESLIYLGVTLVVLVILYWVTSVVLKRLGKNPNYLLPKTAFKRLAFPLILIFLSKLFLMYIK